MKRRNWNFSYEEGFFSDFSTAPFDTAVACVRPTDRNWEMLANLRQLVEIRIVEPSNEQLELILSLGQLKRLHIENAKITSLDGLTDHPCLEELALIWVRGLTDMSVLKTVPNLRSLYLANINSLSDFSSLSGVQSLTTLEFQGKIGKSQRISDLGFIASLRKLHVLKLGDCIYQSGFPIFEPLTDLKNLKALSVQPKRIGIEDWAYLRTKLPCLREASDPLIYVEEPEISNELLEGVHSADAISELRDSNYLVIFTVKGFGYPYGKKAEILPKVERFEAKWQQAIEQAMRS